MVTCKSQPSLTTVSLGSHHYTLYVCSDHGKLTLRRPYQHDKSGWTSIHVSEWEEHRLLSLLETNKMQREREKMEAKGITIEIDDPPKPSVTSQYTIQCNDCNMEVKFSIKETWDGEEQTIVVYPHNHR